MTAQTRLFLTVISTVVGALSLMLYTTLAQDVLLEGVGFCTSSNLDLVFSGLATFVAATISGFLASLIVVKDNFWPHVLISSFVAGKLFFMTFCGFWNGSFWFETGLHLSSIAGLWLGSYGAIKFPLAPV
ncbi:MAG: hypothetical protein AAGB24_14720 [Bacteroidota bacterium]